MIRSTLAAGVCRITAILISGILFVACSQKHHKNAKDQGEMSEPEQHAFTAPIDKAHKMKAWKTKGALETDIDLNFGKQISVSGTLVVQTGGPGIRLELGPDTVAVFDGRQMWSAPSDSAVGSFTLKTWAYFLKAPYKLDDPGTHIKPLGSEKMGGHTYDKAKLTFAPGTGDSPDDWYILFRNQQTNMLHGFAYIVTYGRSVKQAEQHPHAITYEDVQKVNGVPIATSWKFWTWSKDSGFSDEPIGGATLSNLKFIKVDDQFSKPKGAMKMKRPGQ